MIQHMLCDHVILLLLVETTLGAFVEAGVTQVVIIFLRKYFYQVFREKDGMFKRRGSTQNIFITFLFHCYVQTIFSLLK